MKWGISGSNFFLKNVRYFRYFRYFRYLKLVMSEIDAIFPSSTPPGSILPCPRKDVKMPRELALKISKVCSKPGIPGFSYFGGGTFFWEDMTYWCVLRRKWMGCWGLLGMMTLLVMKWIIPENSLRLAPVRWSENVQIHLVTSWLVLSEDGEYTTWEQLFCCIRFWTWGRTHFNRDILIDISGSHSGRV